MNAICFTVKQFVLLTARNFQIFGATRTFPNVLKILIILPLAKDRSKHLWKTASINISLEIAVNLYLR